MTNTLHGLFGTYELLEFRNLSGQLSRRSIDIHFPRYQADCSEDLIEFQRVLKSFGEKMTLEKAPELEIHWEYFYERSIGCVGILKDWLTQAYRLKYGVDYVPERDDPNIARAARGEPIDIPEHRLVTEAQVRKYQYGWLNQDKQERLQEAIAQMRGQKPPVRQKPIKKRKPDIEL